LPAGRWRPLLDSAVEADAAAIGPIVDGACPLAAHSRLLLAAA
jgi:hypothetical protein